MQNRNSAAAIAFIRETRSSPPDIFWASAPDAFEVLKKNSLLQKYKPQAQGVADKVGSYPINDPDGFYTGFAASGYGIMYNTRYTRANNLPAPKEWDDLKKPIYFGHVGFSAPSRSGTSHLTVETILQGEGWDKGWALLLEIAGNFQQVSDRSFGVPDAVNSGQYGVGIVIDFFGLSAKASGFPVEFVYPSVTAIVPANVGIIANAKNQKAAEAFVEFLLSEEGQQILLDPEDPAPAGAARELRQGAGRLSQSVLRQEPRRQGEVRRRRVGRPLRAGQLAVRPARHLPPEGAQRCVESDPRRGEEARRCRRRRCEAADRRGAQARDLHADHREGGERQGDRRLVPGGEAGRRRLPAARPSSSRSGTRSRPRTTPRPRRWRRRRWREVATVASQA